MSKNTITLVAIASLANCSAATLAKDAAADFETGRIAYLNGAKRLIALTEKVGAAEAATLLKKAGVAEHTVKNARQLVRVYEALVVPGHVTEKWFDDVLYLDAVAINSALAKRSAKELAEAGVWKKSVRSAAVECEKIAETGLTQQERLAAEEAAEKAKAAAPAEQSAKVEIKSGPSATPQKQEESKPQEAAAPAQPSKQEAAAPESRVESITPAKPTPPPVNPLTEFGKAVDDVETLVVAILAKSADEVTVGTIRERLVALNRAVQTAIEAKQKAAKKSAAA